MSDNKASGKIITFYSYKGGTGRSMALANVAWVLASNGKRVLAVDWDLEAPGLHRYFRPFLVDKDITSSEGIVDLVLDYAIEAITPTDKDQEKKKDWYLPYANILRYAVSLKWTFPDPGRLDFIPAGKQIPSYASRMNSFDWRNFYDRLGGGAFLEAIKEKMREEYDYILIDSRTGVSDTSGICTIQMPEILVVCFTLNNQNINGAISVATSVSEQRGKYGISIYPVPMRIENAEKRKLELRKEYAKSVFGMFPVHLTDENREKYIEDVQYPYVPYYAYEEILATFGDNSGELNTVLAATERLTSYLTEGEVRHWASPTETERKEVLAHYEGVKRQDEELIVTTQDNKKISDQQIRNIGDTSASYVLQPSIADTVFVSYSHQDERLQRQLENHLNLLKRQGVITSWHDRMIDVGSDWEAEIDKNLNAAKLILLLISPDFMASDYCYGVELKRAMERHEAGDARVIPILLRPVDWQNSPFRDLQVLPSHAKPITSWSDIDDAFLDVAKGIRKAAEELTSNALNVRTSLESLSHYIPRPPNVGFVSRRDAEGRDFVEILKEELSPEKSQLIALWGAGGVGKTTLAAEAVRGLADIYSKRIVWISAVTRTGLNFSILLDEIATQLGRADLRSLATEAKEEQVRALLTVSPTLIVLDGFETMVPEEQARCAEFLGQRTSSSTLITTRQRVDQARNVPIDSMSPEEAYQFLNRLISQTSDSQTFAEVDLERIIHTAEGNPLILQWVVTQIDLAQDPEEVLNDLAHGEGDAAQRVFDRSFKLPQMAEGGRTVLLALSLFIPSATRLALAEVAGMSKDKDRKKFKKAQQTLASLWLVRPMDGGQRLTVEGLTRQLAKARLHSDPRSKPIRQRFIAYFLRYAKVHSQPTPEDFNALEAEIDNILSAMDFAFELENWKGVVSFMDALNYDGINGLLPVRGYWDEAIRRGKQALEAARNILDESQVARYAHNVAVTYRGRGELERARHLFVESLEIGKKLSNQTYIANNLYQLGRLAQDQGELEEARRLYSESLDIAQKLGNQSGISVTLHQLAVLAQDQGELEEARRLYSESLEINKNLGHQSGIASTLYQLGRLAYEQGELGTARHLYDESLRICKKLGDQNGIATILRSIGRLAQMQGDLIEARHLYSESLEIARKLGNQSSIGLTLSLIGKLAEEQGNRAEATQLLLESLNIFKRLQSPYAETVRKMLTRIDETFSISEAT
ncbi:MAG TPA: tetratricopeptide repeat protein [Pyrinomonadaceae bacterium]|jgi:tetratricopeptide (TPR) repeat protein/MinD-like ATPase involved in chromosome partitioning or flagellar assembly